MKKLLCLLLALVMILSLVACDKKEKEDDTDKGKKTTQTEDTKDKGEDKEPEKEEEKETATSYEEKLDLYIRANYYTISEEEFDTMIPEGVDLLTYDDYLEGMEGVEEDLVETYGEDYEINYEIVEERELDESMLSMIVLALGLDMDNVEDSCEVDVEIAMSGSKSADEEPELVTFLAILYEGEWYILSF